MLRKWLKTCAIVSAAFLVCVQAAAVSAQSLKEQRRSANRNTVTIMGSQAKTSYTRMAEDMQNVLDEPETNELRVLPLLGRGGGQNFLDILLLQGIDMGLVERDVVDNFKKQDPRTYGNVERQLRYILKLSNSEMHFFARHDIKKLEDLRGKKVSFYKPQSSSAQAIEKILGACGIEVERLYMDTDLGAAKLRSGEIAAVGRISGAPHGALVGFTREDGHFLPLDEPNLPPGCYDRLMTMYLPAFLKQEHYPNVLAQGQTVPTVANATLLATYNFPENSPRYQKIAKFVVKLFDNIDKFSEGPRHPKWKEVNIPAEVPGWTRFKAAQEWIDRQRVAQRQPVQVSQELEVAFERFIDRFLQEREKVSGSRELTEAQRRTLFAEFLKWYQTQ